MEETKGNSPNGSKKMVIKVGGGGGIGAVVLLGGALATAALASAFALRHKKRSSGENSSPEVNSTSGDIIREEGEEVELERDSSVVNSDQSVKLDDEVMPETDTGNDAVSDDGFVMVKEECSLLAVKEEVSDDHTEEGNIIDVAETEGDDGESSEEDAEVKEMEPKQEENSDQENDAVGSDQIKELDGFCCGNGEINEAKCVEKSIEEDDLVGMVGVEKMDMKSVEEQKQFDECDAGETEIDGKRGEKGIVGWMEEVDSEKILEKEEDCNGEVNKCEWGGGWEEESREEWGEKGKMEEEKSKKKKKGEGADSSTRNGIIWMVCLCLCLCSIFFHLSIAKLALLLFLTLFLLEIYGYSPITRHHHYNTLTNAPIHLAQ